MRFKRANERRGVILLVVLALLTLFAIVGIAFVLYADSEATSARIAREAETQQRADMDPEQALAFFLSQFIYDVNDDATGVGSGMRGHSLARTMYGYNYGTIGTPGSNVVPFSGVGRLHYSGPNPWGLAQAPDDYTLVNYTWFLTSGDGFLRDPERYGTPRTDPSKAPNSYVGGNAPYTYPDLNNFFLAAVKADGTVLAPSFHRPWLFNSGKAFNDMTNTNWTNGPGKYLTLRPRPNEHPNFPAPDDATGDVKNLVWAPGGNDSIWIDPGGPVMTTPDGTKYKMLVAPLIMDLDGRINLNTAGNILGPSNSHVSNQGWGPWEVNLAKVLYSATAPTEYINLFKGNPLAAGNTVYGRYFPGTTPTPTTAGNSATAGPSPHFYAQVDFNGLNESSGSPYTSSSQPQPPGFGGTATSCFPTFGNGYLNGGSLPMGNTEYFNHPLLYDIFRPFVYNSINTRVFRASDMEALLRPNLVGSQPVDANSSALLTDLIRLSPSNFGTSANSVRYRNLVTTLSMDLGSPGVMPYWYSTSGAPASPYPSPPYPNPALATATAPISNVVTFPPLPPTAAITNNLSVTPPNPSEFGADWRALSAAMGRIKLNRPLPPYPHMGSGQLPPYGPPVSGVAYGTSYDTTQMPITNQLQYALSARQTLANDIYRRLLALTGVPPAATPATPTFAELAPRRWLAQLAVNIVDFIDEDDISTPFNFYTAQDNNGQPFTPNPTTQGNDDNSAVATNPVTGANPIYWVFGTELPKVVLNEVLAEAQNPDPTAAAGMTESVKLWLELFNTMQAPPVPTNTQLQDGYRVPLYMTLPGGGGGGYSPYRITIAQNLMPNLPTAGAILPDSTANVLGKANNITAPLPVSTTDADFAVAGGVPLIGGMNQAPFTDPVTGGTVNAGVDPQQFFLIGPTAPVANYQDPFVAQMGMTPGVPVNTPVIRTNTVTYAPTNWKGASTTDERTTGLTVFLRRLANPYLPYQGDPTLANYNPYVTVDYITQVPIRSNKTLPATYNSLGKRQPYASLTQPDPAAMNYPNAPNMLSSSPVTDQIANAMGPPGGITNPPTVTHTFGATNYPLPQSTHYDWLVHLDRQAISPMELLHVSGYQPYQLTQRFILGSDDLTVATNITNMFGHYVPWLEVPPTGGITTAGSPWWFNSGLTAGLTQRLYRIFEFLECGDRATGVDGLGRIPGKVNINTIWDPEILQAIVDANSSIGSITDPTVVTIFNNLLQSRSPNYVTNQTVGPVNMGSGSDDRPFLPLSSGASSAVAGTQFPNGINVTADTLLRLGPAATAPSSQLLLFQNTTDTASTHPYLQTQLLTKLYNNVTTRSNVFAVFVTVGFFEVTDSTTTPPTLGAEIGRSEGRQVRHRMFAIVDRTNLNVFSTTFAGVPPTPPQTMPLPITVTPAGGPQTVQVSFGTTSGANPNTGASWSIGAGSTLVFEPGTDNEETVVLQQGAAAGQLQATFYKSHALNVQVIQRGNPGPWTRYDPRQDPLVVPYYSIID